MQETATKMKDSSRDIALCLDLGGVSQRAAEEFVRLAQEATSSSGRFTVALSGGSTPKALYTLLASETFQARVPWTKVHLFWGDERCVPPDHADSNYRMVRETLLDRAPIPKENIHRMLGEDTDPSRAAAKYEETLRETFCLGPGQLPRFNLVLLGMGDDGHTASLFPHTTALSETKSLVVANYVEKFGTYRLTVTVPVINHAAQVVFLISGGAKAVVLKEVLDGKEDSQRLPSQLIRPAAGKVLYIVDHAAGRELAPVQRDEP